MIFSAWGNGDSQTLLQLVLCSKLTQCQENADLTMYGFMMKSIRGGLRKIRTRDVQKVHCAVKHSTFRTRERQRCLAILKVQSTSLLLQLRARQFPTRSLAFSLV